MGRGGEEEAHKKISGREYEVGRKEAVKDIEEYGRGK